MANIKVTLVVACALVDIDKRVLIAQTDAVERLGKMLGRPGPIGPVALERITIFPPRCTSRMLRLIAGRRLSTPISRAR